ncbi:uncharacterized protein [Aegilops tauschii subsp. strangulata]|uniref:uncharacterized protein n=1 Tax=Aegilops tauschii subsp. strangulata TaxID=200361 RepID=UPI001ABC7C9B|nr:lysine-rich arabinogalactan protein 19-like [Aegilops tauschii subsp. strangulata]
MKLPGAATRAWLVDFLRRLFSALRQRTFWAETAEGNKEAKKRRCRRVNRAAAEAVLIHPAPISPEDLMPPLDTLAATNVVLLPPAPLAAEPEGLTPTRGALSPTSTIVLDGALLSSEDPTPPDGFLRDINDIILHPAAAVPTGPASSVPATGGKLEDDGGFTLVVGRKRKRGNAQATLGPVAPPPAPRHGPPRGWFRHHARPAPPPPSRRITPAARVRPPATASGPASSRALAPSIPAATARGPASSPAPAASIPAATASGPAASPSSIIPQEPDDMEKERFLHLQFREEMSKLKGNKIYCLICYLERRQKLVPMQNNQDDINHHNRASHKGHLENCRSKGCLLVASNRHDIGIHAIYCHPHML